MYLRRPSAHARGARASAALQNTTQQRSRDGAYRLSRAVGVRIGLAPQRVLSCVRPWYGLGFRARTRLLARDVHRISYRSCCSGLRTQNDKEGVSVRGRDMAVIRSGRSTDVVEGWRSVSSE